MVVQRKSWAHARSRNLPLMLPHSWSGLAGLAMLTLSRHLLEPGKGAQCRAPDGISGGLKGWDCCFVLVLCWSLLVSASFAVLCWFCAGFVLVSAGFVVLCWFCAGLCWSLPVSLFCAGFALVPQKTLQLFARHFAGIAKRYTYRDDYWAISWMFVHYPSIDELDHQLPRRCEPSGGRSRARAPRCILTHETRIQSCSEDAFRKQR